MAKKAAQVVLELSAETNQYMQRIKAAEALYNRSIANMQRTTLAASSAFAGIGAAMSAREVLRYADAWTSAKNSLAVAGIVGDNQANVLERLYQAAQANSAPVGALADLFGKAAQASDNLGASQDDLIRFADGVATSLKVAGTSAIAASGGLTQLGQLLGQTRVSAEEFNSVNESMRPLLIAVAKGMDQAGGSVSKLKQLVNDGKVSGQQFFQAFLKGLPAIQAMAANSTQTIEQGYTKVSNALTKYIGETDSSLGASQRLVQGLNALADNFGETADVVLKLASVVAGALVGRAISGMITSLGLGVAALGRFATALRSATGLAAAFGSLGAAAGPVGLLIGGAVVGSIALFSSTSEAASTAARTYAEALAEVEAAAKDLPPAVNQAAAAIDERMRNALTAGVDEGIAKVEEARTAVTALFDQLFRSADTSAVSPEQIRQLEELREKFEDGTTSAADTEQALFKLANSNPNFQAVANAFSPLLQTLANAIAATDLLQAKLSTMSVSGLPSGPSFRGSENASMDSYGSLVKASRDFAAEAQRRNSLTKDQLALETEIAAVRKAADHAGAAFTEKQIAQMAAANLAATASRSGGSGGRSKKETGPDEYEREVSNIIENTASLVAETDALRGLDSTSDQYAATLERVRAEQELMNAAKAAGREITPELEAEIKRLAAGYAQATVESAKLRDAQDELAEAAEDAARFNQDLLRGMIDGFIEGKSAAEVFENALKKIGDRLLDMAMNDLFGGGGGLGGMVGSLSTTNPWSLQ